jgi:RNA polymerase sigma factor (sigma-70 family)
LYLGSIGNREVSDQPPIGDTSGERLKFRKKDEDELQHLSDDDLVAYVVEARNAGFDSEVRAATGILVFRRYDQQLAFVQKKVKHREDAEDILGDIIADMLRAAFRGEYTGEFFSLFFVIRDRRIADFYKKAGREPEIESPSGDDRNLIETLVETGDFTGESDVRMLLEDALSGHSERDRMLIRLRIDNHPAKAVAKKVNESGIGGDTTMTPANVDQIYARFKHKLRPELFPDEGQN